MVASCFLVVLEQQIVNLLLFVLGHKRDTSGSVPDSKDWSDPIR